jgi:7,8-dihydropterin-6-yl-methyl-4-(beta-D-ribofuranosyl)aminobenzene 5'-phosphate synthase
VNTVCYAREISGVSRVWAIIGGFHLAPASESDIQRTIDELERDELRPGMIVPSHCTGFDAMRQFASRMSDEFVLGTVGTTYLP